MDSLHGTFDVGLDTGFAVPVILWASTVLPRFRKFCWLLENVVPSSGGVGS